MTKRLESLLLEFLRTLRFPLEKTRYSGLRNPYHAKKNVNDPVNQRVPWQIEPRRAKEKPLSDGAMRRPSIPPVKARGTVNRTMKGDIRLWN